jgi:uncharacterized coiled-coil DUF342 family protein
MATDIEDLVLTISADTRQIQRALKRLEGDTDASTKKLEAAFGKPAVQLDKLSQSAGRTRVDTANLAAQFQDIAVQLQGGQSPFTVALQQGTQISQVLGPRGAGAAVSALGGAFLSLLNPVSIATIGIIALGGAAVQYASKLFGDVKSLDDMLQEHSSIIKSLQDSYGEAAKGLDFYAKESRNVIESQIRTSVILLQKQLEQLAQTALSSMSVMNAEFTAMGDSTGVATEITSAKFAKFSGAIDDLRASASRGAPDLRAFRDRIAEIANANPDDRKLQKLAAELLELTNEAGKVGQALDAAGRAITAIGGIASGQVAQVKQFTDALKELDKLGAPNLTDRQKAMQAHGKAMEAASGTEERVAAAKAHQEALQRIGQIEQAEADKNAARDADRAAKKSTRQAEAFAQDMQDVQHRVDSLKLEFEMMGKSAIERDRARTILQLENEAKKNNITLTDEQRARMSQLADSYADWAEKARLAKAVSAQIDNMAGQAADSFVQFATGTQTAAEAFKNFANSVIQDLLRIAAKQVILSALNMMLPGAGSAAGGLMSMFGNNPMSGLQTLGRAGGGPVAASTPYTVGERGPELFVPNVSGRILPNHALAQGGGGSPVVINMMNDFRGVDPSMRAYLDARLGRVKTEAVSAAVQAVGKARSNIPGFLS